MNNKMKNTADPKRAWTKGIFIVFITDEKPEKIEKPKDDGPPPDPSTAQILPNKDTIIEIVASNKGLGVFVVGGKMIQPPIVSTQITSKQ